ncbi:hypothetical protein FB451DRAFT_1405959 [Mycena latifolia]|nr:hypothetical protein FB451DRAFT_1405959 [Mycena latifolia]
MASSIPPTTFTINDLDAEIVDEILAFSLVLQSPERQYLNWKRVIEARSIRSRVCRIWRNRIYAHALLWTTITIHPLMSPQYLEFSLARSQSASLMVTLEIPAHHTMTRWRNNEILEAPTIREVCTTLIPVLGTKFDRISSLAVECDCAYDITELLQGIIGYSAPALTRLELKLLPAESDAYRRQHFTFFGGTPHLQALSLSSVPPHWTTQHGLYATLSILKLFRISLSAQLQWHELAQMLDCARVLSLLELMDVNCTGIDRTRRATLLRVTHFLFSSNDYTAAKIITLLDMPQIRIVQLSVLTIPLGYLHKRCSRVFSQLEEIELSCDDESIEDAGTFVRALVNATRIDLRPCTFAPVERIVKMLRQPALYRLPRIKLILVDCMVSQQTANKLLMSLGASGSGQECRLVARDNMGGTGFVEWVKHDGEVTRSAYAADKDPHCGWQFWHGKL